jgi:Uma2 family endonuclease
MFTIAGYLELERAAETRSEYLQGTIVPMAGPTRNHGRIAGDTYLQLGQQLRGRTCEVGNSDTRLYIAKFDVLTYPDVVVTCGPDVYIDGEKDTIIDATLIVEVLSPSTQNYDRSEKFRYWACRRSPNTCCCPRTPFAPSTTSASRTAPGCSAGSRIPML